MSNWCILGLLALSSLFNSFFLLIKTMSSSIETTLRFEVYSLSLSKRIFWQIPETFMVAVATLCKLVKCLVEAAHSSSLFVYNIPDRCRCYLCFKTELPNSTQSRQHHFKAYCTKIQLSISFKKVSCCERALFSAVVAWVFFHAVLLRNFVEVLT